MVNVKEEFRSLEQNAQHGLGLKGGSTHQGLVINYLGEKQHLKKLYSHYREFFKNIEKLVSLIKHSQYQDARTLQEKAVKDVAEILSHHYSFSFHIGLLMKRQFAQLNDFLKNHDISDTKARQFLDSLIKKVKKDFHDEIKTINELDAAAKGKVAVHGAVRSHIPLRSNPLVLNAERFFNTIGIKKAERLEKHAEKFERHKTLKDKQEMTLLKDFLNSFEESYSIFIKTTVLLRVVVNHIREVEETLKKSLQAELLKKYIPDSDARKYLEVNKKAMQQFVDVLHAEMININQLVRLFLDLEKNADKTIQQSKRKAA